MGATTQEKAMRLIVVLIAVMACAQACAEGYGRMKELDDGSYLSAGGARYKYDLNKPQDQLKYELDMKAQMRDEAESYKFRPSRQIREETWDHKGGGIYR
jgi:hypothetical protein